MGRFLLPSWAPISHSSAFWECLFSGLWPAGPGPYLQPPESCLGRLESGQAGECGSKVRKRFVLESQRAGAGGFPLTPRGRSEHPCPSVKERISGCQHSNALPSEKAERPWPGDWPPGPWTWFQAAERKPFSSFFTRWFLRIGDWHSDTHRRGVCYLWRRY